MSTYEANEPAVTDPNQPGFAFEDYTVREMEAVRPYDLRLDDVLYFRTKSGSDYIIEVDESRTYHLLGRLSRRGNTVEADDDRTIGNLDSVKAVLIWDSQDLLRVRQQPLIAAETIGAFFAGEISRMLVINFNPFNQD